MLDGRHKTVMFCTETNAGLNLAILQCQTLIYECNFFIESALVSGSTSSGRLPLGRQTFGRRTFGRRTFGRQTFHRQTVHRQTFCRHHVLGTQL
jgi:hypothetical protein